jgi:hypothetical protein
VATTSKQLVLETYNMDVYGLVRRINRFILELARSQSSGVSKFTSYDVGRALSYINALRIYLAQVIAQPELDLPETSPTTIKLPVSPDLPEMENESIYDICLLFAIARDELANSQSSRLSSNLVSYDILRFTAILDKASNFIQTYASVIEPLDQPETSPMAAMTGLGRQGV